MAGRDCYPYIDGMSVHDYYNLPAESKNVSCSVMGCRLIGIDDCEKNLCRWKFCKVHRNHMHHRCSALVNGEECDNYGTHGIVSHPNHTVCSYHKNAHENSYYKKCVMCKKDRQKYSGYCDNCFAIQYSQHKKGYPSLFGPGRR